MLGKRRLVNRYAAVLVAGLAVALAAGVATAAGASTTTSGPTTTNAGLEQFYQQKANWRSCQQNPQDTAGQALDEAGAQCADVTVPLDYTRRDRRTITVALSRIAATDTAHKIGPLVINLGGPGIPVLERVTDAAGAMGATGARFDLIGMDVRFTGRSTPMDCEWPSTWIPRSAGVDRASFNRMIALSSDLARRCTDRYASELTFASTANAARDLDVVRQVLGAAKMSFLGYSYGTYLGAMYTQLFPNRADRMVLDSAIDPADPGVHLHNTTGPKHDQAALAQWAGWAAAHDADYHLGTTGAAVLARIDRIYQGAARHPLHVGTYTVDDTVVPALFIDPLVDDSDFDNDQLARYVQTLDLALTAGHADPSPDLADALAGILTGVSSKIHSGQIAISCADESVPRDPEFYWRDVRARQAQQPLFGAMSRVNPCAFWPAGSVTSVPIRNAVPALIVHADGDIGTTPELNQAMHTALTSSRMITLDGVRTHGVYLFRGASCVDDAVNAYLNTGTLPSADFHCAE
jgi:pimeloyl-ACP methyl ester carboxylesterase